MMRDTDRDWLRVAETDPYWGVLSDEQFRGQDISPEKKAAFFSSGQHYVMNILGFVKRHISPDFVVNRALDFGCGVGRLLLPLASLAHEAVGVDVAPRMLMLSEQNLAAAGVTNAKTVLGTDDLSNLEGYYNFIVSYIVLQHIPPDRGVMLIHRLLSRLVTRGVFSLHLTYAKERRHWLDEADRAKYFRCSGNTATGLVSNSFENPEGTITMFDYDLNEVLALVSEISGDPLLLLPTNHDGHLGLQMIGMKARESAVA